MYALELRINCPGVPAMVRQYVLMLDLPGVVASAGVAAPIAAVAPAGTPASARTASTTVRPRAGTTGRPASNSTSIAAGSRYRVARGDTLSSIAARVRDRQVSLWAFAGAIQAANPDAFIHGDADLIKLGSEIEIPAGRAGAVGQDTRQPATQATPIEATPAPVQPASPVAAVVAPPAETAAAPTEVAATSATMAPAAVAPTIPATNAVTAPSPATVAPKPVPKPVPASAVAAGTQTPASPNPVLAAGAGIIFGLLVSALLWLRNRLPAHQKPVRQPATSDHPSSGKPAATDAFGTIPVALDTRGEEPGFTVSWSEGPADDVLAAEFADAPMEAFNHPASGDSAPGHLFADTDDSVAYGSGPVPPVNDDITSELEELFDSTDTTIQKRLDAEKHAGQLAAPRAADSDQTVAVDALDQVDDVFNARDADEHLTGNTVDFLIGELRAADDAAEGATVEQPRPAPGGEPADQEPVDIHALATQISADNKQAQTLLEALSLLERDYENELTASQVLDLSAVRQAVGGNNDEPTQVRETQASDRRRTAR